MRHVTFTACLAVATLGAGGVALATPFEPATIPDQVQAVGHLDVDLLRRTQIFNEIGGQGAIDAALDDAPLMMQPLARALVRSARGVSFWRAGDQGAIYLETRDGRALAQLISKLPIKPAQVIDGCSTYAVNHDNKVHHLGVSGDTVVMSDTDEGLARSLHVLAGKAASLAGSNKLPLASRQGVFVFVTLGDDLLNAIQKSAHSKVLQLGLRSLVVDIGETAGVLTANARAEMRTADGVQKGKSIIDGLRALGSLSDDVDAAALLDGVTVTTNGVALEVVAKAPVASLAKAIQGVKARHGKQGGHHHHHE